MYLEMKKIKDFFVLIEICLLTTINTKNPDPKYSAANKNELRL